MAIIVDPTNLDRNQVIFGTVPQRISLYPVNATVAVNVISSANKELSDGDTTAAGGNTFTSAGAQFVSDNANTQFGVTGSVLVLKSNTDAGHYIVREVLSETALEVVNTAGIAAFAGALNANYQVRSATGGTIDDGVSLQALYSYAKEEWGTDSAKVGGDDLIRHPFPFEAITREQMEIGGGTSHEDWTFHNDYTRKKIRTGGWANSNTASTTLNEWTGVITLGSVDSDSQVYFQQTSTTTPPIDFNFLGPVNEVVETKDLKAAFDSTNYLKLFVRKKARSYAGSSISDIGVSTIETIVNRFPLAHITDTAITKTDNQVLGTAPFRNQTQKISRSDGIPTASSNTFSSAVVAGVNDMVNANVVPGTTLNITSGNNTGSYLIVAVNDANTVTVDTSERTAVGSWTDVFDSVTEGGADISWNVTSTIASVRYDGLGSYTDITDGAIANKTGLIGNLYSATSDFVSNNIVAGDMVIITQSNSPHKGVFKVNSRVSANELTINTSDNVFTTLSSQAFQVVKPGMYLQFRDEPIVVSAYTSLSFGVGDGSGGANTISTVGGTNWSVDGIGQGTTLILGNTVANDGTFTVANVSTNVATLVSTDAITAEGATVAATIDKAANAYVRTIGSENYTFNWRMFGNGGTAGECFQFIQQQLRESTDIDYGPYTKRGDITDLLMSFSSPTGKGLNLFIDNLIATDKNNVTWQDVGGVTRSFPFTASGSLQFNSNLTDDANSKYWLFFSSTPSGSFGSPQAVIVNDNSGTPIQGNITAGSISFDYDYDGNVQGGRTPATDAAVILVAIGLSTAQYVIASGTLTRSASIVINAVASLERNYSNPV